MTRPPLELAAELDRIVNDACEYVGDLEGVPDEVHERLLNIKLSAIQLRATLRAQAEAEAGLREALNRIACAWTITANSLYVNGGTEFTAGKAVGLAQASESLTRTCAALAQADAGGEG